MDLGAPQLVAFYSGVFDIFFVAWIKSLTNCLSVDAWAKLGIVFFILLLISFSLFLSLIHIF